MGAVIGLSNSLVFSVGGRSNPKRRQAAAGTPESPTCFPSFLLGFSVLVDMRNIWRRGIHDCLPLADQLQLDEEIAYIHVSEQTFLVISATVIGITPYYLSSHNIPAKLTRLSSV